MISVTRLWIATIHMGTFKKDTLEVLAPMQKTLAKDIVVLGVSSEGQFV